MMPVFTILTRTPAEDIRFIQVELTKKDQWKNKAIRDLGLPQGVIIAAIRRNGEVLIPSGDFVLEERDLLVIGAEDHQGESAVELREITLGEKHDWNGLMIRDLDISRQTIIVMIRRQGTMLVPRGDLILRAGDEVILYRKPPVRRSRQTTGSAQDNKGEHS